MSHFHRLRVVPQGAIDGVNTEFTLIEEPIAGSARVFVNGLEQFEGEDFSVEGRTITMVRPPQPGDELFVHYEVGA